MPAHRRPTAAFGAHDTHRAALDNAAYVAGGPDVVRQLRDNLPSGCRATLSARDGAVIADLPLQLQRLPTDATHLVVSIGGNDALGESGLLDRKVTSMVEVLELKRLRTISFDAHAGDDAVLMFNTGPEHGEATSTFTFEGERLYHASLAAAEYRTLLDRGRFEVILHVANDAQSSGRTGWLRRRKRPC